MTREEAIEVLEKLCDIYPLLKPTFDMAISALREQEELESKLRVLESSGWISVEERLPEDERPVLAYYGFDNCGDGDLGMMFVGTLSYYCFDPDPHWQHASMRLVVTHWMPLPEPPTEEEV